MSSMEMVDNTAKDWVRRASIRHASHRLLRTDPNLERAILERPQEALTVHGGDGDGGGVRVLEIDEAKTPGCSRRAVPHQLDIAGTSCQIAAFVCVANRPTFHIRSFGQR